MKKRILNIVSPAFDIVMCPMIFISSLILLFVRKIGTSKMKLSKLIFYKLGVFPIRDHYYEPLFNPKYLRYPLNQDRKLPGLDLNIEEQLTILDNFHYNEELVKFSLNKTSDIEFCYHNMFFVPGDSEYLYNIVRLYKPLQIIEIGGGYSTLMAINATKQNRADNPKYACNHICIEPYEQSWLEQTCASVIRNKIEDTDKSLFASLEANDILFIDSSHMIRPQGDVLFEYLEVLPILKSGVLIHIHDIFTPKDYPNEWLLQDVKFWNEQYLLEAFLTFNSKFKVIGALNFLKHNYPEKLASKCPIFNNESYREPGSFWMVKV